ncbi:hypothetical protein J1605_012904 [Eschrichtius robustus]|uniref:Spo11/DNA topoisomerase VI subunit A N-terminal domain-containing protein n=1 Tax=Eschrichtius robustus TaxID=9764 RepID=A0AB34GIF0_ESCRO|nr:hypothetical protein J1605_012904 [Eschrichtius robustus]
MSNLFIASYFPALILKILSMIYKLVQSNTYATKRDIYYTDSQLFGNQTVVDNIINDISCMLKVPRRSLHIAVAVPSNIQGIGSIEIMCIYKYGSMAMSFEAHNLTVPAIRWLGLLPSDIKRLGV